MRRLRAALALLLAFAVPARAETTSDPLWTMLSTYVLAPDEKAVAVEGDAADAKGLASLQADLILLSEGFEAFRDEAQVKESLVKLEPRMSPELKPFFTDRSSSLDAIYRTLAVTDYTWAARFPEPPCEPQAKRRILLASRDGLFTTQKGEASPWLVALLGPKAEGLSAEEALEKASAKTRLTAAEYERRRAIARKLTLALASEKAEGAARSKLYCARAAAFVDLAAHHRTQDEGPVLAARAASDKTQESVFVVVWEGKRAAATMLQSKSGPVLVTDAAIVAGAEHPSLFAYHEKLSAHVALTATVVRRHPELSLAVLSYSEDLPRPGLLLAEKAPAKDDLVTAFGHTELSGLWTKTSGLVTKTGDVGFQTDAAISHELTGGPVLDASGAVAGLLVGRAADTEEGRWPVAVPAPLLARWLDDPALAVAAPEPEVIEDAGTAAILSRTRPAPIEAGLGAWNIPAMGPPPPTPRGVCVSGCYIPSAPSRSYSGGSSYSGSGGAELGQALGQAIAPLVEALIFKGIPALFRGIGNLFKKKGSSSKLSPSTAYKPVPAPKQEQQAKPEPVPPKVTGMQLSFDREETMAGETFMAIATLSFSGDSPKKGGILVSFVAGPKKEPYTAYTDTGGVARISIEIPEDESAARNRPFDELDREAGGEKSSVALAPHRIPRTATDKVKQAAAPSAFADLENESAEIVPETEKSSSGLTDAALQQPGQAPPVPASALFHVSASASAGVMGKADDDDDMRLATGQCATNLVAARAFDPNDYTPGETAQADLKQALDRDGCLRIAREARSRCPIGDSACVAKELKARGYPEARCKEAETRGTPRPGSPPNAVPKLPKASPVVCVPKNGASSAQSAGKGATSFYSSPETPEGKALLAATPVGSALKDDVFHRAAAFMRAVAATMGKHFKLTGNDGKPYTLTQTPGVLDGMMGRFEYIVSAGGELTHQTFVKGGTINGKPNTP